MPPEPATQPRAPRDWPLYVLAAVSYIGIGIHQKWMLNWIFGPLWLVLVVEAGARIRARVRQRRALRAEERV